MDNTALLFSGQTADGNSTAVAWPGGKLSFAAEGVFDSGTVTLQMRAPGLSNWIDCGEAVTFAADGVGVVELDACDLRASLSGAGGSVSVSAVIFWRSRTR